MPLPLSVLDLSPIPSGGSSAQALRNSIELTQLADRLGYRRYWVAEHHNMPGLASASPEILIAVLARETARIRVGSGGVMLPNHAPLKVAENFRLLEALYPDRIDLGIGRAPGSDRVTALALRRSPLAPGADDLPSQLGDLLAFASGGFPAGHRFQGVAAMPNDVPLPPVWLLGSSDFSAQVAAYMGAGFAFAHHINPAGALAAMHAYREGFTPSDQLPEPRTILTVSVVCADTDAHAEELARSLDLLYLRLRTGRPGLLPSPAEAAAYPYTAAEWAQVLAFRSQSLNGGPERVRARLAELVAQTGADELMVTSMVHSHPDRLRSYQLLAEIFAAPHAELVAGGTHV